MEDIFYQIWGMTVINLQMKLNYREGKRTKTLDGVPITT